MGVKWEKGEEGEKKRGRALPCLNVLWITTFHYPVAWSLSQDAACTLATLRAGDDSTLSPQSYKSNAYTLTLCIQGNRIPLKVVNKLTFAGPLEPQRPWPLHFLSYLLLIHTQGRRRHYGRYGHGHTGF